MRHPPWSPCGLVPCRGLVGDGISLGCSCNLVLPHNQPVASSTAADQDIVPCRYLICKDYPHGCTYVSPALSAEATHSWGDHILVPAFSTQTVPHRLLLRPLHRGVRRIRIYRILSTHCNTPLLAWTRLHCWMLPPFT